MSFETSANFSIATLPSGPSVLDRVGFQNTSALSETQHRTDHWVSSFLSEACNYKTLSALVGGAAAYRLAKMGVLAGAAPLVAEGKVLLPALIRAGSWAPALAAESAVFTGLGHGLNRLEGSPQTFQNFGKNWAGAAISLGSLKFFGLAGAHQNIVFRHLLASGGMVVGHEGAYRAGVLEKPEGDLVTRLLEAEVLNLHLQGGLALAHGLAPRLGGTERTMEIRLKSQEGSLPPLELPSSWSPLLAHEGLSGRAETRAQEAPKGPSILMMSNHEIDSVGGLDIPRLKELASQGDQTATASLAKARETHPEAARALEEAIAVRREEKRRSKTPQGTAIPESVPALSTSQPFSFKKLFIFLNRHGVMDSYGLIELAHGDVSAPVRKSAQHIQTLFTQGEKDLLFLMLSSIPSIEQVLSAKGSKLRPPQMRALAEDHVAILTADELMQRGRTNLAREALEEYDLRNLAELAHLEPHAVGLLKVLARYKNAAAIHIVQNLKTDRILELALQGHREALAALAYLATSNNPHAKDSLADPAMVRYLQNQN